MLNGYRVTVAGEFFYSAGSGKGKLTKNYEVEINLPSMDSAMSVIKGRILETVLRKKYPEYSTYRTHEIRNVVPFGNAAPARADLWQMSREMVESYVNENNLPVICKIHPTLMALREAVQACESDVDAFLVSQEQVKKDFELTEQLRELNPELYEEVEKQDMEIPIEVNFTPEVKIPKVADPLEEL